MRAGWPLQPAGDGRSRWMVRPHPRRGGTEPGVPAASLAARTTCPRSSVDRALDYESRGRTFESSRGHLRDIAQVGRALGWGPRSRRFESGYPDSTGTSSAWESAAFGTRRPGVQFPRTRLMEGSGPWGPAGLENRRGVQALAFDSSTIRQAFVAQRKSSRLLPAGRDFEIPRRHNFAPLAQGIEQQFPKLRVAGSNPARGTKRGPLAQW